MATVRKQSSEEEGLLSSSEAEEQGMCGRVAKLRHGRALLIGVVVVILMPIIILVVWAQRRDPPVPPSYCEEIAVPLPLLTRDGVSSPSSSSVKDWAANLVYQMTFEEKATLVNGVGYGEGGANFYAAADGYYVGNTLAIPRLGIPSLRMQDAGQGVRTLNGRMVGKSTAWPCALAIAAGWDEEATERWASAMGKEFKTKGANVALGPAVNVHRVATNGRNAEYLSGEDPHLGVPLVAAYVRGMQGAGVASVVKHFVLNQQETHRSKNKDIPAVDSVANEKTMWEQYYPPFQAAVDAGVASVMCSYNHVNGYQSCENHHTLTEDLKERMGFDGWVMSDWWAMEDSAAGAVAGTDQDMPGDDNFFSQPVLASLPEGRLQDMATRVLQGMAGAGVWGGLLPAEQCRVPCNCEPLMGANAADAAHTALARELAAGSAVLLKNEPAAAVGNATTDKRPVLPFAAGHKVAVIGSACDQKPNVVGELMDWTQGNYYVVGGSGRVITPNPASVLQGLQEKGSLALQVSATDDLAQAEAAIAGADVVLVCGGATTTESVDRKTLQLDQEAFIMSVLASPAVATKPVVVLALMPGAIVAPWRHDASAILGMFLSGQETGRAAADILLGEVNPSGKLPVTLPATEADAIPPCQTNPCTYQEERKGGWHVYDGKDGRVLDVAFEFGRGLSYTAFEYSVVSNWNLTEPYSLVVSVKNVGKVAGREVAQLYVGFPVDEVLPPCANGSPEGCQGMPELVLRAYKKTPNLQPGEAVDVTFQLTQRDRSVWDNRQHSWRLVYGKFDTFVSVSSREKRLCGGFELTADTQHVQAMKPCSS